MSWSKAANAEGAKQSKCFNSLSAQTNGQHYLFFSLIMCCDICLSQVWRRCRAKAQSQSRLCQVASSIFLVLTLYFPHSLPFTIQLYPSKIFMIFSFAGLLLSKCVLLLLRVWRQWSDLEYRSEVGGWGWGVRLPASLHGGYATHRPPNHPGAAGEQSGGQHLHGD